MRNLLTVRGKIAAIALLGLLMSVTASAQIKLRKALDFDNDNKADFTIFRPSDTNWYILKSGGGYIQQSWGIPNDDHPTPGDYDGDGKADISMWRDSTGTWYRINSSDSTYGIVNWGISGDEPVGRDFDGDGKTDFGIVRRSNGVMTWYIYRSFDQQVDIGNWGASTDYTAPGDYDGDGKFDLAVQRPGATPNDIATFYVYTQTGNVLITRWGIGSDTVVPGDYDGDHKTDFAIVRDGATATDPLTWYILRSSDNGAIVAQWGITGTDLLCQNDYDGDGITDISAFRDTTGTFYVLNSTGGYQAVNWGIPNDFPVAAYDTH
jgi:hypothetical protein